MATDIDTKAAVSTAKAAETKALNALMTNEDTSLAPKLSAEYLKATKARENAEKADVAANAQEFIAKIGESTETLRVALHSEALNESMSTLRNAGIKSITVEIDGPGRYLVSTHSGKRGSAPGSTRNVERYSVDVADVATEFSAGEVIKMFGPRMANHDERLAAMAAKTLTRKDYAREIVSELGGSVIE